MTEEQSDIVALVQDLVNQLAEAFEHLRIAFNEQTHAYVEVLHVAVRMAERLGVEDSDTIALRALMAMQQADQDDRLAEINSRINRAKEVGEGL